MKIAVTSETAHLSNEVISEIAKLKRERANLKRTVESIERELTNLRRSYNERCERSNDLKIELEMATKEKEVESLKTEREGVNSRLNKLQKQIEVSYNYL